MADKLESKLHAGDQDEAEQKISFELLHPEQITLFKHPLITVKYMIIIMFEYLVVCLKFIKSYFPYFLIGGLIIFGPNAIDGPHQTFLTKIKDIGYFMSYWIILGVASSIGLGTGLHTFVLYLGPWIAKVAMVANDCKAIPAMLPDKWNFKMFDECPKNVEHPINFLGILLSVQFEAFLWGFGTALGELPPYFVAKAAAASKSSANSLYDIEKDIQGTDIISRIKQIIYKSLKKYGFITVLLCASIPNPLFDLAGLTCGHFGIPFRTFFTATAIGKAIIKVHIQMVFVIFVFSKNYVEWFLQIVESIIPSLKNTLSQQLEKQKQMLHSPKIKDGNEPLIQVLWNYFIMLMILYFVMSIVNSLVQGHLVQKQKDRIQKKEN